jgi:SAM-dependent methyltransferase
LFLIEPVAGKRVLPLLGGSAAVWTACLVFFQLALLLGYFVAHWLTTRTSVRTQVATYVGLLVASLVQLMITSRITLQASTAHPIASVLFLLTALIGMPFVSLSMSGPLLQGWYARATSAAGVAVQPYRLYVVSNIGSLLSLVAYPWLIEPRSSLRGQGTILTIGLVLLIAVCGTIAMQFRRMHEVTALVADVPMDNGAVVTNAQRLIWISLAACGSLLLSAVTNYISQNIATLPLMWVIPLIAYLLSFVVAFGNDQWRPRWSEVGLVALALWITSYRLYRGDLYVTIPRLVTIYCGALFLICLFCHGELYRRRPAPSRLTEFYFFLAAGGALGAIVVGALGPLLLRGNYELVFGLTLTGALVLVTTWSSGWLARGFWAAATLVLAFMAHRFIKTGTQGSLMHLRNFYGTLRVADARDDSLDAVVRTLYNGVIEHGQEVFREDLADMPTTYYGRSSGVGLAINLCCPERSRRIGVIGLGTGTIASFGKPGDTIRFYDINPAVPEIARRYFTYVRHSKATVDVVVGDARVSLSSEPPQGFDVLAIDAFAGDAIPVHLITTEALALYRRHLAPGGVVAFHVSNRHLNLAPVVKQLADHENMKAVLISAGDDEAHGVSSSDWVLVTANETLAADFELSKDVEKIKVAPGLRRWTDDYNSLLPILRAFHPK